MKTSFFILGVFGLLVSCNQSGGPGGTNGGRGQGTRPGAEQIFNRLDADGSGGVSYEEFRLPPKRGGESQAGSGADVKQAHFSRLDSNGDGQVSLTEFKAARSQRPRQTR